MFGEDVSINLMNIDFDMVFHSVDTGNRFSSATFVNKKSSNYGKYLEVVWLAFLETRYTVYSNQIIADYGFLFTSHCWEEIVRGCGIKLRTSGVENL